MHAQRVGSHSKAGSEPFRYALTGLLRRVTPVYDGLRACSFKDASNRDVTCGYAVCVLVAEATVNTASELMAVMARGNRNRTVASMRMNARSSRGHAIFVIKILRPTADGASELTGRLNVIDLGMSYPYVPFCSLHPRAHMLHYARVSSQLAPSQRPACRMNASIFACRRLDASTRPSSPCGMSSRRFLRRVGSSTTASRYSRSG